mgnify:CR=1 FL=1
MKRLSLVSLSLFIGCDNQVDGAGEPPTIAGNEIGLQEDTSGEYEPELVDLDLTDPAVVSEAFARTRGSLDPDEQVFYYWKGLIYDRKYADPTGAPQSDYGTPLMAFEGFNVARFEPVGGGVFDMVTREISVYKTVSGQIIDCWNNAVLGPEESARVPVVHVTNDPVNFQISGADVTEMGEMVVFPMEVILTYESPLPVADYPEYSASNTYESSELFNFFTTKEALRDPTNESVPAHISWTRVGQYLPWMQVGQLQGHLVYHAQGRKLENGWDDLPADIRAWVEDNAPEYKRAPEAQSWGSNMTSWRYFRRLLDRDEYTASCD